MNGHIFVTRRIPEAGLEILRESGAAVTVSQDDEEKGVEMSDLLAGIGGCDVLVPLLTEPLGSEQLEAGPGLLGIAQMAVGYNNIDVDAATELGIPVANTPGVLTETTADFTWAMLMAVARRIPEAHNYMVAGRYKLWGPNLFLGGDIGRGASGRRKVIGIIGYGRIGVAVARRATGFDMEILAHDPFNREGIEADGMADWAELPELLERSDFVTLHPPLTPETRHMIDEAALRRMKSTAYLINAARGPVVDETALVRALSKGWIAGAALDVFEDEPAMAPGLAEQPTAVLIPHIASASHDTRSKMATMAATNAIAHLRRERAPNVVNPEVYDTEAYRRRAGK
ncbi:MAG: D-glycerate dehydrogenase [bacterium]|nr:D-glycerate dehydrogenase [bacterium]